MTHASCPSDVGLFGIHFFGLGYVQSVCASVAKLGNTENRALGAVYYLKGTPGFPGMNKIRNNLVLCKILSKAYCFFGKAYSIHGTRTLEGLLDPLPPR